MNRSQTPNDNNDETAAWENMKKRVQNLFTGQEPPSYASIGEVDAMKTRISELEAELARQPKMDEQAATPVLETKPDVILSKSRDTKDQVQATKKSWLPAFFSA